MSMRSHLWLIFLGGFIFYSGCKTFSSASSNTKKSALQSCSSLSAKNFTVLKDSKNDVKMLIIELLALPTEMSVAENLALTIWFEELWYTNENPPRNKIRLNLSMEIKPTTSFFMEFFDLTERWSNEGYLNGYLQDVRNHFCKLMDSGESLTTQFRERISAASDLDQKMAHLNLNERSEATELLTTWENCNDKNFRKAFRALLVPHIGFGTLSRKLKLTAMLGDEHHVNRLMDEMPLPPDNGSEYFVLRLEENLKMTWGCPYYRSILEHLIGTN